MSLESDPLPLENRVGGIFVHVTDLRRSAEWYSKLLGLPLMEERLNGGPVYWFDFQDTHLVLDSNQGNRLKPEWREDMKPRFSIPARDIDRAYGYLQHLSEPLSEPERHGSMAYFNFRDPEGNVLMACWEASPGTDTVRTCNSPILPRIGGVFVDVKDMNTAASWYTKLLGLPPDQEETDKSVYSVPVSRGAALLLDRNRYLNHDSFTELFFFETKDAEATLSYVRQYGFTLASEPQYFEDLTEIPLLDPDGNRILIVQMKARNPG